ncbi:TetR family transcriptional regulator [Haloactinopolyspora alba]|uniref:TetR family transcriptional regulator n=1 Tax=Haloactinopolyspora alba TaxID=648780 RepID=A0A2P8E906_9ACTN|nr:TetR/AcrR family transcriptional regulator [Haloactinopolyspora alba]PSL05934.1 TetR family transcriptional regulator [Haloactinopolyspora alba]
MTTADAPRRGRPPSGGRERIRAATFDLLREKGIARLATKEIAARAGVSEGSIFYHYKNREGLLSAIFENALAPLIEIREEGIGAQSLRETLDHFTTAVEHFLEHAIVVMFAAQADVDLRSSVTEYLSENPDRNPQTGVRLIGEYLDELQRSGIIRAGIDTHTAAFMLVSSCTWRAGQPWLVGTTDGVPERADVVDTLIAMLT